MLKGGKPFVAEKGQYLTVTFVPLLKDKNGKDLPPDNLLLLGGRSGHRNVYGRRRGPEGDPVRQVQGATPVDAKKEDLWGGKYTGPSLPTLERRLGSQRDHPRSGQDGNRCCQALGACRGSVSGRLVSREAPGRREVSNSCGVRKTQHSRLQRRFAHVSRCERSMEFHCLGASVITLIHLP